MIIKKFQAKTEKEAVEAAKKELGEGVVVMNVKEAKKKGFFAFLRPKMVEVTVALEEEPDRALPPKREPVKKQPPKDVIVEPETKNGPTDKAIEEKLDSLQSLLEKKLQLADAEKESEEQKEEGAQEPEDGNVRFLKLLYHTMLENEINEKYANQIIDELDTVLKPNMPIDYMLSNVYQKMILKFGQGGKITPSEKKPKVIFFIGPTGVGKTTTIAKIASRFRVEEKKQVALFTTDTYRIAAAEQLRTYANILEVPFRVIYTVEEIKQGISEFSGYDYIFVDTAGHSHQNESQKNAMGDFIKGAGDDLEKEAYLVVSATTKYKDLISIADSYSTMTDYKLIFTKLDETTSLGNLLNLKMYTGAQMSYVTYGQNVPDDIEEFNAQKTVKTLLGGGRIS
ncbi:MAG: flagellar biosynthesis protein FlhF [Lachnospiraceae bacterium]|nr:flagellar biosynthesis protein FlhF [Lachnospiraceae bacterium]